MFPTGIWDNPMWKSAARAGLRRISQMVSQGNIAGANRLATTPGVLKKTMAGSQIKNLGAGMEGASTLVAHPKRGLEVQKVMDPHGIAGEGMIQNRENFGRAMQHSQDMAQFRGSYKSPSGMHVQRFEYAPGQRLGDAGMQGLAEQREGLGVRSNTPVNAVHDNYTPGKLSPQQRANAQQRRLELQGDRAGYNVRDLHSDNMTLSPGGSGKVIDAMIVPHKGSVGLNQGNFQQAVQAQEAAQQGQRTPYLDYLQDPRRSGNLRAQAFGGAPARGPQPAAPIQATGGGAVTQPKLDQSIQSERSPQIGGASVGANVSTALPANRRRPAPQPQPQQI